MRPAGKGRQPALVERLRDLQDEITALLAERHDVGTEIEALSRRMEMAVMADRPDVALHVAGRLEALAHSLIRRSAA
jgi:uncharacterized protein YlxW (UPF0749 family)